MWPCIRNKDRLIDSHRDRQETETEIQRLLCPFITKVFFKNIFIIIIFFGNKSYIINNRREKEKEDVQLLHGDGCSHRNQKKT